MGRLPYLEIAAVCLAMTVIAGCAQPPFDANAPWRPTQAADDASFAGAATRRAPTLGFEAFETERPEAAEDVEMPTVGGENPWATPARDVVVTLCYGGLINDSDEVEAEAMDLCPEGTRRLDRLGGDAFWNQCPLFQPRRVSYQCVAGEEVGEAVD